MQTAFHLAPGAPILVALLTTFAAHGEEVICHYTYGGETRQVAASPVSSPYAVEGIEIGSYLRLRIVFQDKPKDIASIKVYTYADRDGAVALIHQATYPYPPAPRRGATHGFTGLHFVYEPMRGSELQYWCELTPTRRRTR